MKSQIHKKIKVGLVIGGHLLINLPALSQPTQVHSQSIPDFNKLPSVNWEFKINAQIYSSPIVSEGIVFFGGLDSTLYAIDLNSGKVNWKFRTGGPIRSSVCIQNDNLYLNGGDGTLYELNKNTGKPGWRFMTKGEKKYDFADYFQSTPIYFNGNLFFGSGDYNFYSLESGSGKLLWSFETGNIIHTTPVIDNGKVFFGSFDGNVYALNVLEGKLIWKFKTVGHDYFPKGEVQGSPLVYNKMVYIGARDYNFYALDEEKGFCHWNKAFSRGWALCPNVHDSILYIGSADERVLIAANPQTGSEFWKKKMEFLVFGNNAYSDSLLYVGTTIGKLHAINLRSGDKVWSFETESYLQNKSKFFKPDDSYRDDIYTIIKSNEQFLDLECELGGIFTTPVIAGDFILFTSTNGKLYCLKRT